MPSSNTSIHTGLVIYMARNGRAFARGNNIINSDHINAIEHAFTSAEVNFAHGRHAAEIFGNIKDPSWHDADSWRDHWNNEVGRRMADWAIDNGYGPEVLDRLMLDAYWNGKLITSLTDPRISIYDYAPPDPTWHAPTIWDPSSWGHPADGLQPRDYSGLPDPTLRDWLFDRLLDLFSILINLADIAGEIVHEVISGLADMLGYILGDPIVLDLDGDGIELTALAGSATHFDLDNDGIAERTGWVSPQDGFLVHDIDQDGQLDGIGELLGNANTDGYDVLAGLDSDSDGRIDANDAAFARLLVWRDLNSDGIATADELQTMAQAGIAALDLDYTQVDESVAGNVVARIGSYERVGGGSRDMASVDFALDQTGDRPVLPENADLGDLPILPNLPGSASIADLRTAMYFDPTLRAMVGGRATNDNIATWRAAA